MDRYEGSGFLDDVLRGQTGNPGSGGGAEVQPPQYAQSEKPVDAEWSDEHPAAPGNVGTGLALVLNSAGRRSIRGVTRVLGRRRERKLQPEGQEPQPKGQEPQPGGAESKGWRLGSARVIGVLALTAAAGAGVVYAENTQGRVEAAIYGAQSYEISMLAQLQKDETAPTGAGQVVTMPEAIVLPAGLTLRDTATEVDSAWLGYLPGNVSEVFDKDNPTVVNQGAVITDEDGTKWISFSKPAPEDGYESVERLAGSLVTVPYDGLLEQKGVQVCEIVGGNESKPVTVNGQNVLVGPNNEPVAMATSVEQGALNALKAAGLVCPK